MKVISGIYKGKTLKTLDGDTTRPTTSRVKESIFNIIQFDVADSEILDLFSGSGQMGIESLSRGAKKCDFVDMNKNACQIVDNNLKKCEILQKCQKIDYISFIKTTKNTYDIIFLDPPYGGEIINNAINLINSFKLLKSCGIIVCETSVNDELCLDNTDFLIHKNYRYGTINVTTLKSKE